MHINEKNHISVKNELIRVIDAGDNTKEKLGNLDYTLDHLDRMLDGFNALNYNYKAAELCSRAMVNLLAIVENENETMFNRKHANSLAITFSGLRKLYESQQNRKMGLTI